jgi:predicted PurR-regulated permease PerM
MPDKNNYVFVSLSTGTLIRTALVVLGAFLIWFLRKFILIILTAIVIASFVESAIPYFRKIKINRVFSVVILYTLVLVLSGGIFYLFAPLLITEIYNLSVLLSSYIPNSYILDYFQSEAFSEAKDVVTGLSKNLSIETLLGTFKIFITNLSAGFFQTLSSAFGSLFNLILILVISFYLSIEEKGIEKFLRIILPIQYEDYAVDLWKRSRDKIALWVKGQVVLGLLVAVLIYLVLSLLNVKYALVLALMAGITDLIPYGTIISLIPAAAISYTSGGVTSLVIVTITYLVINQFENFLFAPVIIKNIVGLSPLVVILATIIGFELAGLWGLILAIPVAASLMELMSDIEKSKAILRTKN